MISRNGASQPPDGGRFRVVLTDLVPADGLAPLHSDDRFEVVERVGVKGDDLADALADADAVIVRSSTKITREALARAERLQAIGRAGVGVDNIDVEAATERGIAVLNAPSGNTISAAELTMALLLALVRRLPAASRSMRDGEWDRKRFRGTELYRKTLGLVGAGRIGGEVARRARAFGMQVIAYDPYLKEDRAKALEIELAEFDDVLSRADVLSLHVPLTDDTRGLIGEAELERMRPGAFIINAARGGVLDQDALLRALDDGHLAGAALDVYTEEPPAADHPLRSRDDVVLTPHLGAATVEAQHNVAVEVAHAVRAALTEGDFSHAVNAPAVGGEVMRRMAPLLDLAERLGRLGCAMADGRVAALEVRYAGSQTGPLSPIVACSLVGVLSGNLGPGAINMVNATHLAAARDLAISEVRLGTRGDYAEYIELRLTNGAMDVRVAGALLGEGFQRVVRLNQYHVDIRPEGCLVILRNRDVPGVIGRVGTILGEAGINIGEYDQARMEAGGEALAAISIDTPLPDEVKSALEALPEVLSVRQVDL
ncbi:MAG: phosphoglycerate dehydrogenase [Gemmatimonadota bacterium]|jgi:D-3-phosphoglycerate dehydrogenase